MNSFLHSDLLKAIVVRYNNVQNAKS